MIDPTIIQLVSTVGFPIGMCFYLVLRFERTIEAHTKAIEKLEATIIRQEFFHMSKKGDDHG